MEHEAAADSQAVERYVLGELSAIERDAFESHYFDCRQCAEDVRAASVFIANLKPVLAEGKAEKKEAARERRPWLWFMQPAWSAALACALAVVAGYQSFVRVPGLESQVAALAAPRQIEQQFLRPETRGDAKAVAWKPGESLWFTLDVPPGAQASSFVADVVQNDAVLATAPVRLKTPDSDQRATIFLPRPELKPGRCVVVLYTSKGDQRGPKIAQYPFELQPR